jgi:transposase-like protein
MKNRSKMAEQWQETLIDQPDFLKTVVQSAIQKVLDIQFTEFIGADPYERTQGRRAVRNGSYQRQLKTRVGSIELNVCRDREGKFKTDLFDRYQRSEKALVLSLLEMYLWGVSTRNVEEITESLCGYSVSKSQVSDIAKSLDERLEQWRNRELLEPYEYLVFDARYEKVREGGRVVSKAVAIAVGITKDGKREVLGTWVINSESFEQWDDCIQQLIKRGLRGVKYVVTDQNQGLRTAIGKRFQGVVWQRCQVHFMRNFLSKLSKQIQPEAMKRLKKVFASEDKAQALEKASELSQYLRKQKKEQIADWLEENLEETLGVYELPPEHRKRMKSTNMLERLNQELKRRSRVVRIFPNEKSCLRLMTALCQEYSEDWMNRKYL